MPSTAHDVPLMLFDEAPGLVPRLLAECLHIHVPDFTELRGGPADFTQIVPTEYRADRVIIAHNAEGKPVLAVVVESQTTVDGDKLFSWPLYVAALHGKNRCTTGVLVVAFDDAVARWARQPITTFQPGSPFVPWVLGRNEIPWITAEDEAHRAPELAVLSARIHGNEPGGVPVAATAILAAKSLDDERARLYHDLVLEALNEESRRALEHEMQTRGYEYQSDFAKKYVAGARAKDILTILAVRKIEVPEEVQQRIMECSDIATLSRWLERAVVAASAAEVIKDG